VTSCRTSLAARRSRRWSGSLNGWAGAPSVWLTLKPVLLSPAHPTSATATVPGPTFSRNRSTAHVERSTKLPDEVFPPDWRALSVVLNDRAAIFAEEFPAVLAGVRACDGRGVHPRGSARPAVHLRRGVAGTRTRRHGSIDSVRVRDDQRTCLSISRDRACARSHCHRGGSAGHSLEFEQTLQDVDGRVE
jgi:hypothetical protein